MGTLDLVGLGTASAGESLSARSSAAAARVSSSDAPAHPLIQDLVEIANVPAIVQIEPLQAANPTRFQLVLSDAIRQLKEAELQTTDPAARAYLVSLAERFRRLQETGVPDLSTSATPA